METEGDIVNYENGPGKLGSLSASSYSPYSTRAIHYVPWGPLYSLALLVESLLERELRRAMDRRGVATMPLYPEGRACRYPTVPRLIDVFESVQRHTLLVGKKPPVVFTTKLTRLQRQILSLLGMPRAHDG